jgi:hypothetical protein
MLALLEQARTDRGLPLFDALLQVGDEAPKLDEATREYLRALGYVE